MKEFIELAKESVINNYNNNYDGKKKATKEEVFVVWSCKTLKNKKAILSGFPKDFPLYEFTWNGEKCEGYLDCYLKVDNEVIKI